MKKYLLLFIVFTRFSAYSQSISVCSWNIRDFGNSKSDVEIAFIANAVKSFDIIAIQEVVAGKGGAQAVARLADQLNRTGNQWHYSISNVTSSSAYKAERYAFIWKTSKVTKVGESWLEEKYGMLIDREPYYCRFKIADKMFTLVNFHAITKSLQPETEIKYFKFLPGIYPKDNLIFCGDFNVPQSHTVFMPLRKMGYTSALVDQKTTLKQQCTSGECLASEFDNFYFNSLRVKIIEADIVRFYKSFSDLEQARSISDHVPIYMQFSLN